MKLNSLAFLTVCFTKTTAFFLVLLLISNFIIFPLEPTTAQIQLSDEESFIAPRFNETFDGVAAPALPSGWLSTATGAGVPFVTATNVPNTPTPDTPPNAAFAPNPSQVGLSELISPPITIGSASSKLIFRNAYNFEQAYDGGVLEIKIGTADFQDVLTAGGSFASGGYDVVLPTQYQNPLGGRQAWSGISGGGGAAVFLTTEINLPAAAAGQIVQFKWRVGTDNVIGSAGWRVDSVQVTNVISGENQAAISIPSVGSAVQYPSEISVSNLIGSVTNVAVNLELFSHTAPDDADLLLVAPNGRKVVLMSDVGGNTAVSNLLLTIDDSAAATLPDNAPLTSGFFKPANYEPGDLFPSPAPAGELTGGSLAAFNGSNPNGVWKLFVVDDNGENAGSINGGWSIAIQTSNSACSLNLSATSQAFPISGGSGSFNIASPFGCSWTANTNFDFITITSGSSGEGNGSISFTVAPNNGAARTGTIVVANGGTARTFQIQQNSGCLFSLSQTIVNFGSPGGANQVQVTASGACVWQAVSNVPWITIANPNGTGNGTINFTVAPNAGATARTGAINLGAQSLIVNQTASVGKKFDFDGDSKADISVFRPDNGFWYVQRSGNNSLLAAQFGQNGDKPVAADYDGDKKTDLAVFRAGVWYILESATSAVRVVNWGLSGDVPVPADYDGDGKTDLAVYRPQESGAWYVLKSSDNSSSYFSWGLATDRPVPADYDGDGKADLAVFRASSSQSPWLILRSSNATPLTIELGSSGDIPVPSDYDGDGRDNAAVFRRSNGSWYFSTTANNYQTVQWGASGDIPVPADYDGDGKTDFAIFRAGVWYILFGDNVSSRIENWGLSNDLPAPAVYPTN